MNKPSYEEDATEIIVDIREMLLIFEDVTKLELSSAEKEIEQIKKKLINFFAKYDKNAPSQK